MSIKQIHKYFNVNTPDFGDFLEYHKQNVKEIRGKEQLGCGISTVVYDNGDKILAYCIDYNKLLYLKKTKIGNFKFLKFFPYRYNEKEHYIGVYEMDKLNQLPVKEREYLRQLKKLPNTNYVDQTVDPRVMKFIDEMNAFIDWDVMKKIHNKRHTGACLTDINQNQFLKDNEDNYICVDPLCSEKILNLYQKKFGYPHWKEQNKNLLK